MVKSKSNVTPVVVLVIMLAAVFMECVGIWRHRGAVNTQALWDILFFGGCAAFALWKILRPYVAVPPRAKYEPEKAFTVTFDDTSIAVNHINGDVRSVQWEKLTKVGIRTTDEGPFQPDIFWGFHAGKEEPEVVYPQGAAGDGALLTAMQKRLIGFRNEVVIEAMGSTNHAYFVVWEKDASTA
jgi:hypothetical protein